MNVVRFTQLSRDSLVEAESSRERRERSLLRFLFVLLS